MIILSPYPKLQFIDNNGTPMAGCYLWTYQAGTDTQIATYTDSTGSSFNTNPIILDAGGRANVWLDSNTAYKFVLLNFDGSVLYTVDNINSNAGETSVLVNDIAALRLVDTSTLTTAIAQVAGYYAVGDGGGGTFYFNSTSTLSDDGGMIIRPSVGTGRWLREGQGEINVLWYGAINNGIANCTPVFQAANVFATAAGWTLYLPAGIYFCSTNPSFSVNVRFSAAAILRWSGYSLTLNPTITDYAQHFDPESTGTVNFGSSLTEIYPEWFGAKGDGSFGNNTHGTDDTTAIQITLNSCSVGCSVVFNTAKKYWLDSINPKSGTTLRGSQSYENEDPSQTGTSVEFLANLQYIGTGANFIDLSNSGIGGLRGVKITDLIIDGTAQSPAAIYLQTADSIIERCTIRNAQYGILFGGNTNNSGSNRVNDCNIRNMTVCGIANTGSTSIDGFITNIVFGNCLNDVNLTTKGGWTVNNINHSNGLIASYEIGATIYNDNTLSVTPNASQILESKGSIGDSGYSGFSGYSGVSGVSGYTNVWDRTFLVRQTSDNSYNGAQIHDALSLDNAFNTPNVDTRSYYSRDFNGNHFWGDQNKPLMALGQSGFSGYSGILSVGNISFGGQSPVQFSGLKRLIISGGAGDLNYQIIGNVICFEMVNYYTGETEIWPQYSNNISADLSTTTSVSPIIGTQTFVIPTGKTYVPGNYVLFTTKSKTNFLNSSILNSQYQTQWFGNDYIWALITDYNSITGSMTVDIKTYHVSTYYTSSTSVTVGLGSKTFTVSGGSFTPGEVVTIYDTYPDSNQMRGTVTSYIGTTLIINATEIWGSGAHTNWVIIPSIINAHILAAWPWYTGQDEFRAPILAKNGNNYGAGSYTLEITPINMLWAIDPGVTLADQTVTMLVQFAS